jgi:hypothetical protein
MFTLPAQGQARAQPPQPRAEADLLSFPSPSVVPQPRRAVPASQARDGDRPSLLT